MGKGKVLATVIPPATMKGVRVLAALWVCLAAARVQMWYSVQVSQATLEAETPRVMPSSSRIVCAMRATHDPSTNLLCPEDACALYTLRVGAAHDDTAKGPTDSCWTKLCECGCPDLLSVRSPLADQLKSFDTHM